MKKEIFIALQLLILLGFYIFLYDDTLFHDFTPKLSEVHIKSHTFIVNNNLAQYSSYITKHDNKYVIEVYIFSNFNYAPNENLIEVYSCLLKFYDTGSTVNTEKVIELNATSSSGYYFASNRMIRFELTDLEIEKYFPSKILNIQNVVVAVIRKDEYDKNLNESQLNSKMDSINVSKFNQIILPYSLVIFQKPIIIDENRNLQKSVSSCIPFSYGDRIPHLENWIDMHLKFGIEEIMFYDSTSNNLISKLLQSDKYKNEKRLKVRPYRISFVDICSEHGLARSDFNKVTDVLKVNCKEFFDLEFKEYLAGRQKHEQITSNDCLTHMSKYHEFVAYYDIDEFIFPRTLNITYKPQFSCTDKSSLCSMRPFTYTEVNPYYNYVDSLVEKYRNGRDKSKLSSISFEHAAYLIQNEQVEKLFTEFGSIITSINMTKFPMSLILGEPPRTHKFVVEESDLEHVRYLYSGYNEFAKCLFKSLNSSLNSLFQRFVYFRTEPEQRWPKCIHYSKNVFSVFPHYPTHVAVDTWDFFPSYVDGNMLPHFRNDMNWFDGQFNSTIKKLNIDFEYLIFVSQHGNCN